MGTHTHDAVRRTAIALTRRIADRWPTTRTWRVQEPASGEWVASRTALDYIDAIARAAQDDIEAVDEGVQAAIDQHAGDPRHPQRGDFPPSASDVAHAVRAARRRHAQAKVTDLNKARHDRWPSRDEHAHCGYLARAAMHAHLADQGMPITAPEALQPYVDLVQELDYRNHHGCDEYRDVDGHLHPADPLHDPRLHATALAGAERIWREQGMPDAPSLAPPAKDVAA